MPPKHQYKILCCFPFYRDIFCLFRMQLGNFFFPPSEFSSTWSALLMPAYLATWRYNRWVFHIQRAYMSSFFRQCNYSSFIERCSEKLWKVELERQEIPQRSLFSVPCTDFKNRIKACYHFNLYVHLKIRH